MLPIAPNKYSNTFIKYYEHMVQGSHFNAAYVNWFQSYLSSRSFLVNLENNFFQPAYPAMCLKVLLLVHSYF